MKGGHRKHSPSFKVKVALEAIKNEEAPVAPLCLLTETNSPPMFLEVNTNA